MTELHRLVAGMPFRTARDVLHASDARTLDDMCAAAAIAAPTFAESARAHWLCDRLREHGLDPVLDDAGNVIATTPAVDPGAAAVVIAAHLDTVFDAATDLTVQRDADRIHAPGISDNARGLAGMLALARALHAVQWPLLRPVVFLGSAGEEGIGDLHGAKHFVAQDARRIHAFIALDGAGVTRIINSGVGSRRLRITYRGPGGHSWADFGAPNAIHAAARCVSALTSLPLPRAPRTTLTVARIGGGTAINAIPGESWLDVDLRSESGSTLAALEVSVRAAALKARALEMRSGTVECTIEVIGDRPAGCTDASHPLVLTAMDATRAIGATPELASSSTDANAAMSAGLPAIAIGAGGEAGGTHTLSEWYSNGSGALGVERALMIVMSVAGIAAAG